MSDGTAAGRTTTSGPAQGGSGSGSGPGSRSGTGSGSGRVQGGGSSDPGDSGGSSGPSGADRSPGSRGRTTIADGVVEKIAGLATREVVGVHAMGGGMARTFGAVRERVPGGGSRSPALGVKAEVGEVQTALDLEIVVEYGVAISDVARAVRENVVSGVERMTGLEVVEVNIAVSDVKLPDEEDDENQEEQQRPRLQ